MSQFKGTKIAQVGKSTKKDSKRKSQSGHWPSGYPEMGSGALSPLMVRACLVGQRTLRIRNQNHLRVNLQVLESEGKKEQRRNLEKIAL